MRIHAGLQTRIRYAGEAVYYDNNTPKFQCACARVRHRCRIRARRSAEKSGRRLSGQRIQHHRVPGDSVDPAVLSAGGRNDIAYSCLRNPKIGDSKHVIKKWDAITIHEQWNGSKENSLNHAFLTGSLSEWLYQDLTEIAAVKPGYREICCRPYVPADVDWAKAQINTVRGWVKSEWKKIQLFMWWARAIINSKPRFQITFNYRLPK
jgi:hypothetical protein